MTKYFVRANAQPWSNSKFAYVRLREDSKYAEIILKDGSVFDWMYSATTVEEYAVKGKWIEIDRYKAHSLVSYTKKRAIKLE